MMGYHWRRKYLKRVATPNAVLNPHKSGESFPITLFLKNLFKYGLSCQEVKKIVKQRLIKVDGKSIDGTKDSLLIRYDAKGRFVLRRIKPEEAMVGSSYTQTPMVKVKDTLMVDNTSGEIKKFLMSDTGNLVMNTGGHNFERVGTIHNIESPPGSFDIFYDKDALGHTFATRLSHVFVIGKGNKPWISLARGQGVANHR
ncbi:unnamed protein product [Candidula unifasciata]|uniref:Small ribosomal subunit protein eS4 C-terminal domain-containing protein n=1 Tax=Candidula unifasciata TaxID=100452 RepID=A0A8S3ZD93_9EUPU|nr:unnamed protein product [Candidula unifasciata]